MGHKGLFSAGEPCVGVTTVAEATAPQSSHGRARSRRAAVPRRSVCIVAAQADISGRSLRLAEGLQASDSLVALYETSEFLRAPNPDFDVYVFHHPTLDNPQLRNVVNTLGKLRRILISDWNRPLFCDEIYGAEQSAAAAPNMSMKTTDYVAAMKLFRRMSAATAPLLELASLYHPDAELATVPECISPRAKDALDILQIQVTPRNPKSIGFVCNRSNSADDIGLIYDAIFKILSEDSECRLTFFGSIELTGPLRAHPQVIHAAALPKADPHHALSQVACVIEPHKKVERDRCTSRSGFLQASLAGCQYVATPLPDLSGLKAPNLKLATSEEEWYSHILGAFKSAQSMRAARSAASYVKKNHSSTTALNNFYTLID